MDIATHCLRQLLLPIRAAQEVACAAVLNDYLHDHGVQQPDFPSWVSLETGAWKDTKLPSAELKQLVVRILDTAGNNLGPKYFDLHKKLTIAHMSHEDARGFLGNALLMYDLAHSERQSAAQISRLLSGRDDIYSRQAISYLLPAMGVEVALDELEVAKLFQQDKADELDFFADADLSASIDLVSNEASKFGFSIPLGTYLGKLAQDNNLTLYGPYLQILHYQCTIAEFFDHAVTDLYEFSPRGQVALWLFAQYPNTIASAGNPFLNNMKSVAKIDEAWALSKKPGELPGAQALWRILAALEAQGFAARREVATLLRLWLHRIMRLSLPNAVPMLATMAQPNLDALLNWVEANNTATFGIVEQRVVDAISSTLHLHADGWRSRGIGDSVNATNISKRKVGDCDYQNTALRSIVAYESHGGTLTDVYLNDHMRTLRKVLELRVDELAISADLGDWSIRVVFIAHVLALAAPAPRVICGIPVQIELKTFADMQGRHVALAVWDQYLLEPLRANRTPMEVKLSFMGVVAA